MNRSNFNSDKALRRYRAIAIRLGGAVLTVLVVFLLFWRGHAPVRPTKMQSVESLGDATSRPTTVVTSVLPDLQTPFGQQRKDQHRRALDWRLDGWNSEAFSDSAEAQIKRLAQITTTDSGALAEVLAATFSCSPLRPSELRRVFQDPFVTVLRPPPSSLPEPARFSDADGLLQALRGWSKPLANCHDIRIEVKTISARFLTKETGETVHVIQTMGCNETGLVEQHADWRCSWTMTAGKVPRLLSVELQAYEQSASRIQRPLFEDVTLAVMGSEPMYEQQLAHGLDHWLSRIETIHGMYLFAEYGIAIGDVNGDHLEDVYVCQPGGLPNRLLVQNEDGTVSDRSRVAGVDWLDHSSSALLVDLDNDGDLDLAVAIEDRSMLIMENDASGGFRLSSRLPIADRHVQGLSAADYDNDGDLDLYLAVGFADELARQDESRPAFVYHDANEGGANVLFRNDLRNGELRFTDVTRQVGLDVRNRRHSLAAAWEDFDNDGDQDLYVANDYGQNCLYRNDHGQFHEVAPEANVIDFGSGMSVSWSDYDRDGDMDLYVGNMFSSAGSRITLQAAFQPHTEAATRQLLRRFAKGNTLFRNDGTGTFTDLHGQAGLERGRWAWSSIFADLNNDGWEDVVVANGYMTRTEKTDL